MNENKLKTLQQTAYNELAAICVSIYLPGLVTDPVEDLTPAKKVPENTHLYRCVND